jgi:diguanylate cyclase (GGDEF)-like protein
MVLGKTEKNPRILVVDDNVAIHDDFKKVLSFDNQIDTDLKKIEASLFGEKKQNTGQTQYDVDYASQGQDAYTLVAKAETNGSPYSVAFIDGRMPPGWDGIETIQHLWQVNPDLQVVLCTAYADYSWSDIQRTLGETDSLVILKKPFDNVEVMQLAHALSRKWEMSRQINGKLHKLAYYDSLTNLPNRDHFLMCLSEKVKNNSSGALFFIDLDNFKRINDTLGHSAGDDLLKIIAKRLSGCVRGSEPQRPGSTPSNNISARLGGDEFAVILEDFQNIEDIKRIAERIVSTISKPVELGVHQIRITPSIGIALFPEDGSQTNDLIKNADLAMYFAKCDGRNHFHFFHESMNAEALKKLTMETHLRQALDHDEFTLAYQPQISLVTKNLSGFEALLRWQNLELGQVSPMEFIPVAEDCGLIIPIGDWVMKTACQQAKRWIDDGYSIHRIGVNVSPNQFLQHDFFKKVKEILENTDLPKNILQIEITESLLMKDSAEVANTISSLHRLGVQIAIDDFGTGYSNLSRLKELPIDQLKIDQSFVRNIDHNTKNQSILRAIIAIAAGIELDVIAEGVETDQQLDFLQKEQCDEIQGFLISRPMTAEKATEYLQTQSQIGSSLSRGDNDMYDDSSLFTLRNYLAL